MAQSTAASSSRSGGVLIDARKLGDGGIGVYIENLIDGILEAAELGDAVPDLGIFVGARFLQRGVCPNLDAVYERWSDRVEFIFDPSPKYSLRELFAFSKRQRSVLARYGLFHSPHYTLPYFLPIPSVVTIHDCIHISHPQSLLHKIFGVRLIRSALRRADRVLTVSEHSRQQIERLAGSARRSIAVIPNAIRLGLERPAAEETKRVLGDRRVLQPYLLVVGSDRPHKGFAAVCQAFRSYIDRAISSATGGARKLRLVVVGTDFGKRAEQAIRASGLEGRVDLLGAVTLEQLNALLCGSEGLLVASQEEGFCLPALEAMALGVPVLSTPLPSVIEICGAAAWYAPGFDAEAISESLPRFIENRQTLAEHNIRLGLTRARAFDRVRAARETLAIYREVLGERSVNWHPVTGMPSIGQRTKVSPPKWQSAREEIRRVVGQV